VDNTVRVAGVVRYHVTRRRGASGNWTLLYDFEELMPRFKGLKPRSERLARVYVPESGEDQFFAANGSRISGDFRPVQTSTGLSSTPTERTILTAAGNRQPDSSSEWLTTYVVTQRGAARTRNRLERNSTESVVTDHGRRRFATSRGRDRVEVEVNEATGTTEVIRLLSSDRLVSEITREYAQRPNGAMVLKTERISRLKADGTKAPDIVRTFRNVRVLEERK
jgi:hypothetical protein